jgi:molybdenum cofactor cytidylyltransferase
VIILAAGNSSRLGRPKQLLPYRGRTLLTHVVREVLATNLQPIVVVTGAFWKEINESLQGRPVDTIFNSSWEQGIGSGIATGVSNALSRHPDLEALIVAVCDQPFISAELLLRMVDTYRASGKGIIASAYANTVGTPVLFGAFYFQQLMALSGSEGAKKLLKQYTGDLATVDFPRGDIDIDTEADVGKLEH